MIDIYRNLWHREVEVTTALRLVICELIKADMSGDKAQMEVAIEAARKQLIFHEKG